MLVSLLILMVVCGIFTGLGFYYVYSITSRHPTLPIASSQNLLLNLVSILSGISALFLANFVVLFFFLVFGIETGLESLVIAINIVPQLTMSEVFVIPQILSLLIISIVIIAFAEELLRIMPFVAAKAHPQVFQNKGSILSLVLFVSTIFLTSLWFGFLHLNNFAYLCIATIAGIFLSIQITLTDNILSVVFTHGLYDFILFSLTLGVI